MAQKGTDVRFATDIWRSRSREGMARSGPASPPSREKTTKPYCIEICASPLGWAVEIVDQSAAERQRLDVGDGLRDWHDSDDPLLANLTAAFENLKPFERSGCDQVRITLLDSQIEVLDNRLVHVPTGDSARIAQFAADLIGDEKCGLDAAALPGDARDGQILAFVSERRIRQILNIAGDLAVQVRSITPYCQGFLQDLSAQTASIAGLFLGARDSQIVLGDRATGGILLRRIDVGLASFATALAEGNALPIEEAFDALQRRDLFAPLVAGEGDGFEGNRAPSSGLSRALEDPARRLLEGLEETLDYFVSQRMAEPPEAWNLFAPAGHVKGFVEFLCARAGLPVLKNEDDLHTALGSVAFADRLNLLRGTGDDLIAKGRSRYRFNGDRFVESDTVSANKDGTRPLPRAERSAAARPARASRNRGSGQSPTRLLLLVPVLLIGLGFVAFEQVLLPVMQDLNRASVRAEQMQTTLRAARQSLEQHRRREVRLAAPVSSEVDKILWVEKFLLLAQALPPALWLTDTFLAQSERKVGTVAVVTTKLIIRGGAPQDGRDHLEDVADFINALESSGEFMRDFRQITFEGADNTGTDERAYTTFEIHAWYDRNRRQQDGEQVRGQGPLGAMQQNIGRRNDNQEAAILGGLGAARE